MEEINLENPENITEQRYLELAQQFQEQFNIKDQSLRDSEAKFLVALKGLAVGYATLRLVDDYMDNMVLEVNLIKLKSFFFIRLYIVDRQHPTK